MVLVIFIISRLLLFLGTFIAQKTVPYLGFFPYKELLVDYGLPQWISAFANFDGIHYLLIAKQGYSQWEQAFFPLYPVFIRLVSYIIPNYLVSALFISNGSFLIGLIFLQKLLRRWGMKTVFPILFLLSFPTAFFFGVVYTEGLFFVLLILSLYFLQEKKYWLAGLFAALSSATRLIGIFLIIPFFFHFLAEYKGSFKLLAFNFKLLLLSPFIGLLSYMVYLWSSTGDPLFFFNSQPLFGAHRSTHLILLPQVYYRYFKILFTAAHNFQWYLSFFEVSIFSFVLFVVILDLFKNLKRINPQSFWQAEGASRINISDSGPACRQAGNARVTNAETTSKQFLYDRIGLGFFSLVNLVLPTLTGTFSSIPRYALFSLSLFIYLGRIKNKVIKGGILLIFITLQIILLSLFIQGYFVG